MPPPRRATDRELDEAVATALFESGNPPEGNAFTDGSVVSGVYSGADIELIVHLPTEEVSAALREIEELQGEMSAREAELAGATWIGVEGTTTGASIEQELRLMSERIAELMEEARSSQATTLVLAEIQTLSVSIHREKFPVRTLGSVYPRSYCRGPRTISGSLIFTVFHRHIFQELLEHSRFRSTGVGDWDRYRWSTMITDQLPPLDISIRFANEYGNLSWMGLFGVDFINEGMTMSIEDLFLEGVLQYVARDIDLIRNVANRQVLMNQGVQQQLTGSQLLTSDLALRTRGRRNPFL